MSLRVEELLDKIYKINRIKIFKHRARVENVTATKHWRSRRFTSEQSHKLSGGCEAGQSHKRKLVARRGCGVFHKRRRTCKRKRPAVYRVDGRRAMSAGCHQLTVRASPTPSARSMVLTQSRRDAEYAEELGDSEGVVS